MNSNYRTLAIFEYSSEAQILRAKLLAENLDVILVDEVTIDADPLISQAIGGVKLKVHTADFDAASRIYNDLRSYEKAANGAPLVCPQCGGQKILIAPLERKNIFYMLFPFFEKKRHICNECKTIF